MQINFHSIVWSSNQSGWSNHPKPKLKWVVKVICTVWNHEYKKSVKKSRSPHALSQVPKGKSLPNIPVLFSQISHLCLTTPPQSVWPCHLASGCHSEASLNLPSVTSQDQEITHHSLCHLRQDHGSSALSNPLAGTTRNQNSGHGIQRMSKQERKQQKIREYTGNAWCCKLQRLNRSCSHLKHSHAVTLQLHCCLDILCYTEHMLMKECFSLSKDDLMDWTFRPVDKTCPILCPLIIYIMVFTLCKRLDLQQDDLK